MEIKSLVILQMAFDLVAGGLIIFCLLREQRIQRIQKTPGGLTKEDIEDHLRCWENSGRELLELMQERLGRLEALHDELERAEIRASETLDRLQRARESLNGAQSVYHQAAKWIREGMPLGEVARRSGLGIGELRLMRGLKGGLDGSRPVLRCEEPDPGMQ